MAEMVLLEVALTVACDGLLQAIAEAEDGVCMFDSVLTELETTVNRLKPKVNEIDRLNRKKGNSSIDEIREFLTRAEQLVKKCSEVAWWNMLKKYKYSKKLMQLNASLRRLIEIDLQFDQVIATMEISVQMEELKRLVLMEIQERNRNDSGSRIFRRRRTAKGLGRSKTKILHALSRLNRIVLSTPSWITVWLISFLTIPKWGYQRVTGKWNKNNSPFEQLNS